MKLIGSVKEIKRLVAQDRKSAGFDEKRAFTINARPATPLPSSYYGYGGLNFVLHGRELQDFGVDLNDEVEIFVVPKGASVPKRDIEDISFELYQAEGKLAAAEISLAASKRREEDANGRAAQANIKGAALQTENARLLVENEALRSALRDRPAAIDLTAISSTAEAPTHVR